MKRMFMLAALLAPVMAFAAEDVAVADIKPLASRVYGVRSAVRDGADKIRVTIGASATPLAKKMTEGWRIVSADDPAYAYEKFVKPSAASVVSETVEFPYPSAYRGVAKWRRQPALSASVIELKLPTPMKPNCRYGVVAMGGTLNAARGEIECVTAASSGAYVDEKYADEKDVARVVGLRNVLPVGGGKLLVELGGSYAAEAGDAASSWNVTVNGTKVAATVKGRRSRLDFYLPCGWPFGGFLLHDVYLDLGTGLKDGDKVAVELAESAVAGNHAFDFTFSAKTSVTRSIQANQVGYLPDGVKIAYVGQWMGSGGALELDSSFVCEIVDAKTGKTAHRGAARLTHRANEPEGRAVLSACNVWEVDFTQLTKPGEYFVAVPGMGRSLPFRIHRNVYAAAFRKIMQGLYCQRCGSELDPKLTGGWKRIACHADEIKESNVNRWEFNQYGPFQDRCTGKVLKASGGHHDAGDYNPRSHLDVAQALMDALELKPQIFADSQLGVPERGNGIPDILDEALVQLKLWVGLQDADGGVYDGTESHADPHFFETVELDSRGDYAFAKNCKASYFCAGAFAQAARLLAKSGKKEEADAFLARAEKAYAWAKANPAPADKLRAYVTDPMAYAAVNLYHTTRDAKYHEDFKKVAVWTANPRAELSSWGKYDQSRAGLAYLCLPDGVADKALKDAILSAAVGEVEMFASGSWKCGYKFLRNPYAPISWGTGAYQNYAVTCAHVYAHTGEAKYRDYLIRTCDNTLGANPMGLSYIKGLGTRTLRCPLHNSRYRPEGVPVDGLEGQGPAQSGPGYSYKETAYPAHNDAFAQLYTFVDCHFAIAMDEPTVNNMANTALVFGLLSK
jgi:endoglucanase